MEVGIDLIKFNKGSFIHSFLPGCIFSSEFPHLDKKMEGGGSENNMQFNIS